MEIDWCQGSLATKGPPCPRHTNTTWWARAPVSPRSSANKGPGTGASPRWISYKLHYGRHPRPGVSYGQDRNHLSMCFWVEVGVLSNQIPCTGSEARTWRLRMKKSRNCHHRRTLGVDCAPARKNLMAESTAEELQYLSSHWSSRPHRLCTDLLTNWATLASRTRELDGV